MRFRFKSIYAKFALIFLGIWWLLHFITFGVIMHAMSASIIVDLEPHVKELKNLTKIVFLCSTVLGTIIILLAVRGIVRPIKSLSKASRNVAKGNFNVSVEVKSIDEVGELSADFNKMVHELKSIDALRKDFVSNVSHEFRTPITSINGFARLIHDNDLPQEQLKEYSSIIVNESKRLMELSSDLLRLSELDNTTIREGSSVFSLDEQIRKTVLLLEPQWSKKDIEFELHLEEAQYVGDEDLLKQVWINLIQNAIKFSYDKGLIIISLCPWNDALRIRIEDNGVGIPDEDKQHIFDRFYKGNKSQSQNGNGLGLSIVSKIVEIYKGEISVESELGKGSTFTVYLPLAKDSLK